MGAGGSNERRGSLTVKGFSGGHGDSGAPMFQQRSHDMTGNKGVNVNDSAFTDIVSYTEGGGILPHQDIAPSKTQHLFSNGFSNNSALNAVSHHHPHHHHHHHQQQQQPLQQQQQQQHPNQAVPCTPNLYDNNNTHYPVIDNADNNKENTLEELGESSTDLYSHNQRLQRTRSEDYMSTTYSGPSGSSTTRSASASVGGGVFAPRVLSAERGGLIIGRRTSDMSFQLSSPPSERHESPDKTSFKGKVGSNKGSPGRRSQHLRANTEDMCVEEVA